MTKKIWSILLVFILISILSIGYILLRGRFGIQENPYKAVPQDASVIIEASGYSHLSAQIREENLIWEQLKKLEKLSKADRDIIFIDSLLLSNREFGDLFGDKTFLLSVHQTGKKDIELLFLMNLSPNVSFTFVHNVISNALKTSNKFQKRDYQKVTIGEISSPAGNRRYVYSLHKGIFMFSSSPILVESAIRQLDLEQNVFNQRGFIQVNKTAGRNTDANLYINFDNFPRFLSVFLNESMNGKMKAFRSFANWAELDLHVQNDAILLNGFSYSSDSSNNYLNFFTGQSAQKINVDKVLPDNTINYLAFGISDFEKFFNSREKYLRQNNEFHAYKSKLDELETQLGMEPKKLFLQILENEVALAHTDIRNIPFKENSFALFKVKSISQAREYFHDYLENYSNKNSIVLDDLIEMVKIDEAIQFPIYKLPSSKIPEILFGGVFEDSDFTHLSFVGTYLVFGNSTRSLSNFIHYRVLQQTLINNFEYRNFLEKLSSKSNFFFYSHVPRSTDIFKKILTKEYAAGLEKHSETLQKIQAIGFQFSVENTMVYNNFVLKYQPVYNEKAETEWESLLDTSLMSKPVFVSNHNTGDKEIFIQDEKNNIYLINSTGRILWKINIPGKIISEIYQIDFYKNKKLQLLLNTKNHIYLIDRNGNYVEKFPVKLRAEATNGLALFDYERNRNYRYCLAGNDKKIYLFDKEGKTINGWSFPITESIITTNIQHIRAGAKDYIVFSDQYKLYILNRRGKVRVSVEGSIEKPKNQNIFFVNRSDGGGFVTTQADGTICFVDLEGKVEKKSIIKLSPNHFFDFRNLDGTGSNEFIFVDGKKLMVYNSEGKEKFSYEFKNEIRLKPIIYSFSSRDMKIGVVSGLDHQIFLFNNDGKLYSNFPLSGQTLFSIGKFRSSSNKFNLIVGGEDNFLYNYSVN